jgi:hypothetical protein
LLLALALALAATSASEPPAATFPGPRRELASPDSAVTVFWQAPDAAGPDRTLLLKSAQSPKTWRIHQFPRSVRVSWGPRGHFLAVTELGVDDVSTFVHDADTGDVQEVCTAPRLRLGSVWVSALRRSCEQAGWTKLGELRLKLSGTGVDGQPFDLRVAVPIGGPVKESDVPKP